MESTTKDFIKRLISYHTSLEPLYAEHIKDYGELLPHVFFGDFSRWVINNFENNQKSIDKILYFLDREYYYGSDEISELISVSFLENIDISFLENIDISFLKKHGRFMLGKYL